MAVRRWRPGYWRRTTVELARERGVVHYLGSHAAGSLARRHWPKGGVHDAWFTAAGRREHPGSLCTTDSVPVGQRPAYWLEALSRTFSAVNSSSPTMCIGLHPYVLAGESAGRHSGMRRPTVCTQPALDRTGQQRGHDRTTSGQEQLACERIVPRGDMLMDLSAPYDYAWSGDGAVSCIQVPIDVLGLPVDIVRRAARQLPRSPLYRLVTDHISHVTQDVARLAEHRAAATVGATRTEVARALLASAAQNERYSRPALADRNPAHPDTRLLTVSPRRSRTGTRHHRGRAQHLRAFPVQDLFPGRFQSRTVDRQPAAPGRMGGTGPAGRPPTLHHRYCHAMGLPRSHSLQPPVPGGIRAVTRRIQTRRRGTGPTALGATYHRENPSARRKVQSHHASGSSA
jgi:hypothetical protein